jgi:hypothetical protein
MIVRYRTESLDPPNWEVLPTIRPGRAFGIELALLLVSHRWSEGNSEQQSFRRDETAHGLAPGFFPVLDEHSMPLRFKLNRCFFDIVNVELEPSLRRRNIFGPGILTKAGMRCLRKRPQSETVCAYQSLRMEITARLLFEADTEHLAVEFATCGGLTDDRTKARDEQNSDVSKLFHIISFELSPDAGSLEVLSHQIYLALPI